MSSSLTEVLAHGLESARATLQEAETTHADALSRVEAIQARLTATQGQRETITQARLNGKAKPEDAAEFAALGADMDALAQMLTKARAEAESASPDLARAALANAEAAWQRHQHEETIRAVHERVTALEHRFTACLSELAQLVVAAGGASLRDHWTPSAELETIMRHSRPETIAGLRRAA